MKYKSVRIQKSSRKDKKMMAVFETAQGKKKVVHFGATGYEDYTTHKDPNRKRLYVTRHKCCEKWNKPDTPGALAYWILWNTPSLKRNIQLYKKRFF